jgi:MFS family permease
MPESPVLQLTVRKISRRLLPFLLLMYVMAFLDRSNLGFAKNAFQADTGLTDAMYAFGASIFFLGYSIFEVPSNLIMHRVGARRWMFRIMVTWGLISALMFFAQSQWSFYLFRFLLGVAEAGFFPGVIYYLTFWFPARMRARSVGIFYFGIPLSLVIGGPLSGFLLELDGLAGWKGWQWMFLVEGLLAVVVGIWAYWYLDSAPRHAKWLSEDEKRAIEEKLIEEEKSKSSSAPRGLWSTLTNARVQYFCLTYFLIQICLYGVVYYLPSQVAALVGEKIGVRVGLLTTIPWLCALLAAWLIPLAADTTGKHRLIASASLVMAAIGMAGSVLSPSVPLAVLSMSFATAGIIAAQPVFWAFPASYLSGISAAGGIAFINSVGTLGGFVAPNIKTWAELRFDSTAAGMLVLTASAILAASFIYFGRKAVD